MLVERKRSPQLSSDVNSLRVATLPSCLVISLSHHPLFSTVCVSPQLTSTSGALCVVNPLYIHEHGDEWLTQRIKAVQCTAKPSGNKRPQRLSSTRKWDGAGLQSKRAISLDQEPSAASAESSGEAFFY